MLPDGTLVAGAYSVRTGSCASRFDVRVPRRVARGKVARVRIVDGWGIGDFKPRLCIAPPRGDKVCSVVGFKKAVTIRTRRFRAKLEGRWRVELRVDKHRVRRTITVGGGAAAKPPPVVLTTGDSTMQGVDNFLADELGDDGHGAQRHPRRHRDQQVRLAGDRRGAGQALQAALHRDVARRQRGLSDDAARRRRASSAAASRGSPSTCAACAR